MTSAEDTSWLRRLGPLMGWTATLIVAVLVFGRLGRGVLAAPPLTDLGSLAEWTDQRTAPEVLFAGLRLLVLGLAWYLLAVTAAGFGARLVSAARLVALTDLVTARTVRRLLQGAFGLGVLVASLSAPPGPGPAGPPRPAEAAELHGRPPGTGTPEDLPEDSGAGISRPPVLWGLPVDGPNRVPGGETGPAPAPALPEAAVHPHPAHEPIPAPVAPPPADLDTVEVRAGDHLWGIAADALAAADDAAPTDDEITAYWRRVVAHNRDMLPDPANADLIHPGLVVELPRP